MIFRWRCDSCGKEIESGKDRLKIIQLDPYLHDGDLCKECWNKIKKGKKEKTK